MSLRALYLAAELFCADSFEQRVAVLVMATDLSLSAVAISASMASNGEMMAECPFCELNPARVMIGNRNAVAIRDAYPVSPGHTLIIPRRHMASFFDLAPEERVAMLALLDSAREQICADLAPGGFNIGINDGSAAGQTVPHLHIHLIPRFEGDVADPRGGVRWVVPQRAAYWADP